MSKMGRLDLQRLPGGKTYDFCHFMAVCLLCASYLGYLSARIFLDWSVDWGWYAAAIFAMSLLVIIIPFAGLINVYSARKFGYRLPVDPAELIAADLVKSIALKMSVSPPKVFITDQFAGRTAWVAGTRSPYFLIIERPIVRLAVRNPARFSAAIAHELAHVANSDARDLALAYAADRYLTFLLLGVTGMTAFSFLSSFFSIYNSSVDLGNLQHWSWLWNQFLRLVQEFVLPVAITSVAIKLCYAKFIRQRELMADWRAGVSGYSDKLIEIIGSNKKSQEKPFKGKFFGSFLKCNQAMFAKVQGAFSLHPSNKLRLFSLQSPMILERSNLSDHLANGVLFGIITYWITDIEILDVFFASIGAKDIDNPTAQELSKGLLNPVAASIWLLYILFIAFSQYGSVIIFSKEVFANLVFQRPWLFNAFKSISFWLIGTMIGSLIWIGNLREFGYLSTEPDRFSIFSVLESSMGEKGSSIISLFGGMFFAFYFSKIWTGWWLRGHGYNARTSKQVSIIAALSVYIAILCISFIAYLFIFLENVLSYKFDENFDPEQVALGIIMLGVTLLLVALLNVGVFFLARPWRNKTIDGVLVGNGDAEETIPTANLSVRR
jgi:hypothetical protein